MGWVGDVIGGVTGLGGAALQAKAQNKATDIQAKAGAEALAFEREKEAERRRQFDAYQQNRMALLRRYGVDLGGGAGPAMTAGPAGPPQGAAPQAAMRQPIPSQGGPMAAQAPPANIRDILASRGDLEGWDQWGRYGLGPQES